MPGFSAGIGEIVRFRSAPNEVCGTGRSIRGMAGSDRPRMTSGEMSDSETGEPLCPILVSGVEGSMTGFCKGFDGLFSGDGSFSASSRVDGSRSVIVELLRGLVTPRVSS